MVPAEVGHHQVTEMRKELLPPVQIPVLVAVNVAQNAADLESDLCMTSFQCHCPAYFEGSLDLLRNNFDVMILVKNIPYLRVICLEDPRALTSPSFITVFTCHEQAVRNSESSQ